MFRTVQTALLAAGLAVTLAVTVAAPAQAATPGLYADPYSQGTVAAAKDSRLAGLAAVPQGKWFTDWTSVSSIQTDVRNYVAAADVANQTPVVVLYQIPGRDCGGYSSGGLATSADYTAWIDGAAAGIRGHAAIVIVEPDALPMLGNCATAAERTAMLRYAAQTLSAAGAQVYLDAGHSNWQTPAVMAQRLVDAGVGFTRGFSTNVANFQPTASETAYADAVNAELANLGVGGKHYVIDTGRNGAGSTGDVCNPPSARIGQKPTLFSTGALDAYLWVKNVGETDGACNGGPASGFSTSLALALTAGANLTAPSKPSTPHKPTLRLKKKAIVVKWKKVTGATAYRVTFTPKKGRAVVKTVSKLTVTLAKPKATTRYKVTVAARNAQGYSKKSTVGTIITKKK